MNGKFIIQMSHQACYKGYSQASGSEGEYEILLQQSG